MIDISSTGSSFLNPSLRSCGLRVTALTVAVEVLYLKSCSALKFLKPAGWIG